MIEDPSSRDLGRRRVATADRALACAEALEHHAQGATDSEPLAGSHTPQLRRLARRSDAVGLPCLAEAARLAVAALTAPRSQPVLVHQAIDLLTLAGRAVKHGDPVRADLHPVVEALRDHLRYAGATGRHD